MVRSDAGRTDSYAGAVPADLVLLCGVFGNLSDEDVQATVGVARQLCTAGGTVAWTRGRFDRAGFEEVSLDSPKHRSYRVGVHRFLGEPELLVPGRRFFTFKR